MKVKNRIFFQTDLKLDSLIYLERFNYLLFLSYCFLQVLFRIEYLFSLIIYFSVYLSAETNKKTPSEQVFRTKCFGNIEFGVDCNVSVRRLDFWGHFIY